MKTILTLTLLELIGISADTPIPLGGPWFEPKMHGAFDYHVNELNYVFNL